MVRRCVRSRNIKNRCSIYIYDISSLRVNDLILILLTWRKWLTPNNASKWQMGFNSAFKGLISRLWQMHYMVEILCSIWASEQQLANSRQYEAPQYARSCCFISFHSSQLSFFKPLLHTGLYGHIGVIKFHIVIFPCNYIS